MAGKRYPAVLAFLPAGVVLLGPFTGSAGQVFFPLGIAIIAIWAMLVLQSRRS